MRRLSLLGLLILIFMTVVPPFEAHTQQVAPDPVLELMEQMPPEAKVGQLVLVAFPSTDVGEQSEIYSLIRDYWIGGVLLRPENGNFGPARIAASDLLSMTNNLQGAAWDAAESLSLPVAGESSLPYRPPYIPLFVATTAGDTRLGPTAFVSGTVELPSPMALGATWTPSYAEASGTLLGQALAAVGINLFLGPDLDVLYTPSPGDPADLGVRTFGGDPYWVGEMGTAYIRGLHAGSDGRLMVAPRHLPGLGSTDRPLDEEISTVQKPLEQLKQIELVPFFAAAASDPGSDPAAADAFLVTHIRYRGFQGDNIRESTQPISLDPKALKLVAGLEKMAPWREAGGILIADNLGLQSVHQVYDPRGNSFNARRVTLDALGAGNDLMILDRFAADDRWDLHFSNIRDTLKFLASRYKEEPAFQVLVDEAVYRVLSAKLRLYSRFHVDEVRLDPSTPPVLVQEGGENNTQVALNALTLVYPLSDDLLPASPQSGDTIVIFAQESLIEIGEGVAPRTLLQPEALSETLMRFYGPEGTGVVRFNAVRDFSFQALLQALRESSQSTDVEDFEFSPVSAAILAALRNARWVVFATTGLDAADESSYVLEEFLSVQANVVADAQIAVLSFGPPYELDSTDFGKLDLYYALYSSGNAFVEASIRALFRDLAAPGDSPVDIPALDYYVPQQTMPDQNQLITLSLVDETGEELTSTAQANIHIGDVIHLRTGVILDRNGRVVPDGTPVHFTLSYPDSQRDVAAETVQGVAQTAVTLERVGQLNITARADPAGSSVRLELVIRDDGVTITEIEPTPTATLTPSPTPTATPTPTPTPPAPAPPVDKMPDQLSLPSPERIKLIRWAFASTVVLFAVSFVWARERSFGAAWSVRLALSSVIGGLGGYILLMIAGRWWAPILRYTLVGREYLAGGVAIGAGFLALMGAFLMLERRQQDVTRDQAEVSTSYSAGPYSRSRT
jgi:beta-N-acetylhexosaminidase